MFGSWPVLGKIALRVIPSTGLVAFRVVGAALALVIVQRLRGRRKKIAKRDFARLALYSLLGVVLNQLLFVKGLALTTVINATLIGTTIPIFTLVVSILLGYDSASFRKAAGILLAAAGVVYLIAPTSGDFSGGSAVGNLLIVANSICYGTYLAISKDAVERYGALTTLMWLFLIGSIFTAPLGMASLSSTPLTEITPGVWLAVLYIILVPTVGAYYLNSWALERVEPSTVAVYIYFQPLIAFSLAPLILNEPFSTRTVLASILIFGGIFLVTRRGPSPAMKDVAKHPDALSH